MLRKINTHVPGRVRSALLVMLLCSCLCTAAACADAMDTPLHWAVPMDMAGVPNLHKVDDGLFRSGQPTREGMKRIEAMGVRTVVNLRSFHSDRDELEGSTLGYEQIFMKAWHPERSEVVRFLRIVTDPRRTPVLVHCWHGADRTGTMCAVYRIVVQGWSKEEAIREMTEGGFGFHGIWVNLPKWIEDLNVECLKEEPDTGSEKMKQPAFPGDRPAGSRPGLRTGVGEEHHEMGAE